MIKSTFKGVPRMKFGCGPINLIVEREGLENERGPTTSPIALKVGDVMQDGPSKGWIYCETIYGHAFLVAPKDSGVMRWREAMEFAARENSELPRSLELDAMFAARDAGAFKGTFNVSGLNPGGWYWSAMQASYGAWCHCFRDGSRVVDNEINKASVRCIRRYQPV